MILAPWLSLARGSGAAPAAALVAASLAAARTASTAPPLAAARTASTAAAPPPTIAAAYDELLASGRLQPDATQASAVAALQLLQQRLAAAHDAAAPLQQPEQPPQPQHQQQPDQRDHQQQQHPLVQGAYLWGPVGSGKTLLLDLFLATLPPGMATSHRPPLRLHFHSFMLGVHQQLHALHEALPRVVATSRAGLPVYRRALPPDDPVLVVARAAAARSCVVALDELHVTDAADALLLARLFGEMLARGCCVLFTSNRPARDLYARGLNRSYFEPFIQLVDDRLLQLRVAGGRDYRQQAAAADQQAPAGGDQGRRARQGTWFAGAGSDEQLQQHWQQQQQQDHAGPTSIPLPFGRSLWVPMALQQQQQQQQQSGAPAEQQQLKPLAAVLFTFEQLCGQGGTRRSLADAGALSANDYLALLDSSSTLYLQGVPQLAPNRRDEARRLVTLLDLLYEAHTLQPGSVRLVVSAAVPPGELLLPLLAAAARQGVNPNLGRARQSKLDVQHLLHHQADAGDDGDESAVAARVASAVAGEDATVGSRHVVSSAPAGTTPPPPTAPALAPSSPASAAGPPALLAEEVLMYHRASSRLQELCRVQQC